MMKMIISCRPDVLGYVMFEGLCSVGPGLYYFYKDHFYSYSHFVCDCVRSGTTVLELLMTSGVCQI